MRYHLKVQCFDYPNPVDFSTLAFNLQEALTIFAVNTGLKVEKLLKIELSKP